MHRVRGIVQHYAWGHESTLPDMLGVAPDGRPWAEVWFGTHPSGTSSALGDDRTDAGVPLDSVAGRLPYMVKLLAAAAPLSLQTHPSGEQAARGYAQEDALGIPRDSSDRIYVDPYAKPELIIALGPFRALCGVRPLAATLGLLHRIGGAATRLGERLQAEGVEGVVGDYLINPEIGDQDGYQMLNRSQVVASCAANGVDLKKVMIDALRAAEPAGIAPVVDGRVCQGLPGTPCRLP